MRKWIGRVALSVVLLGVLGVPACRSKSAGMTYADFRKIVRPGRRMSKDELYSEVGKPAKMQIVGKSVYLYYHVKEGKVQVVVNRQAWEGGRGIPEKWEVVIIKLNLM